MQKSILLNLCNGGTVTLGIDHFVLAERIEGRDYTTVIYETMMEDDSTMDVLETPEQIHTMLNSLKD